MSDTSVSARRVGPDDWVTWRDLRLRSLAADPDAFGSTLEREQAFDEGLWRQRLTVLNVVGSVDGAPAALGGAFESRPGWMQVFAMWSDPAYRGRGLATAVLGLVVAEAEADGLRVDPQFVAEERHAEVVDRAERLRGVELVGLRGGQDEDGLLVVLDVLEEGLLRLGAGPVRLVDEDVAAVVGHSRL